VNCTGIAASWCPIHGDCTCPREDDGSPVERVEVVRADDEDYVVRIALWRGAPYERIVVVHDSACPLHGNASTHAEASEKP
jgi:hypothetical protein